MLTEVVPISLCLSFVMVIVVVVVELMCIVGGLVSIVLGLLHLLFIDRLQLTSCAVAMVTSGVTGSTVSACISFGSSVEYICELGV